MAGSVKDTDRGYKSLMKDLANISGAPVSVLVGVSGKKDSDLVVIAASNEFGTEDGHIPERSYLRSTIDDGRAEILDDLTDVVKQTLDGASLDRGLGKVGAKWAGKVQDKIRDLDTPPSADATKADKKRRTGSEGKPLIDSGRLRQSITWEVERGD